MTQSAGGLAARLLWYANAALGPICAAGAQFLLSLTLLARLPVEEFGRISFLIVVSQFSLGLWSALFTAPLLVLSARSDGAAPDQEAPGELAGLGLASRAALLPAAAVFALIAWAVGVAPGLSALFALYAALVLLRQFARAQALAQGRYRLPMVSDVAYSGALLAGTAAIALRPGVALGFALAALVLAILVGLAPLALAGRRATGEKDGPAKGWRALGLYRAVWARDSRWSLLGVVTTEMTVNSHSYLVTGLFGPAAFAPIAATALFVRPVTVAINALAEFERARCARRLVAGEFAAVAASRRALRLMLGAVWLATALAAGAVLAVAPARLMLGKFGVAVVLTGTALWFAVVLARAFHAPEGVILQAAGRFRQLALISVGTAGLSIVAVVAFALLGGPLWSIAGIVAGEGCFALALWIAASRYMAEHAGEAR